MTNYFKRSITVICGASLNYLILFQIDQQQQVIKSFHDLLSTVYCCCVSNCQTSSLYSLNYCSLIKWSC